jgi:valyl-tRNA synthetase
MLHPFMPYLTEELWQRWPGTGAELHNPAYSKADKSIMLANFPTGDPRAIDETAEAEMNAVIEAIKRVRNIRSEMNISPSIKFRVHIAASPDHQAVFRANEAQILKLARAEEIVISDELDVPKASAKAVTGEAAIAVPLEGLIDFDKERERLRTQITKLAEERSRLDVQLSNQNFLGRAPAEKVEALRERHAEIGEQIGTLETNLAALD